MATHPTHKILMGLYSGLWRLARPVLKRHKRLKEGFAQRLVPDSWPEFPEDPEKSTSGGQKRPLCIWMQAASGGEAWLVHSLVPALARRFERLEGGAGQPLYLLCTTCTRQGLEVLEKLELNEERPDVAVLPRYFPLDSPGLMEKALKQATPDLVVLLETELWPGLLDAAKKASVPVLVLNARMTEKSLAGYGLLRSFFLTVAPEEIRAVSEADAGRFCSIFDASDRVAVMNNIKFDRLEEASASHAVSGLRFETGFEEDSLLAVLASVREEEEDLLLPTVRELWQRDFDGKRLALAIAPRHMHRLKAWQAKLSAEGIAWRLRSRCSVIAGDRCRDAQSGPLPLMLWDSFGDLLSLYAMADAVFVGGSLAPLGGQNFLEPASLGLVPVTGPHIDNFHWVGEEFFAMGLGLKAGPDELKHTLLRQLEERYAALQGAADSEERQSIRAARSANGRERFREWLAPRLGGSAQAADLIVEKISAQRELGRFR